ncbi:MAG: hypothetical protein ACRDBG_26065 [Waterburya sp.]
MVSIPNTFHIFNTALDDPIEQGVTISDEMIWVVFSGTNFTNSKTSPPTAEANIKYSIYIAVQETGCCDQHHESFQYGSLLMTGLYNTAPRCIDSFFALTGTGWLVDSFDFVKKWSDSNHYVYRLAIRLPVMLNIVTHTTYTGVISDDNCSGDNPFDPRCYIDYDRQVLVCPDGEKPLLKVKLGLWRNAVNNLGSNIIQDYGNNQ